MSFSPWRLDGRRALVTGASGGLGLHFAGVLADAGAEVVLAARRTDALEAEVARLRASGARAHAVPLDVTDAASVSQAFDLATRATGGAIDIVVNNAGISGGGGSLLQGEESDWDAVLDTNLKGAWLVGREAARRQSAAQQPGSVINIASILGLRVAGGVAAYCASKAGLIQLTRVMALELARHRIRVNALAPGYVETDLNREFFASEAGLQLVKRIPQRRLGQARELDGPLLLLASEAGSYMTGAVIEVDGGHLCSSL